MDGADKTIRNLDTGETCRVASFHQHYEDPNHFGNVRRESSQENRIFLEDEPTVELTLAQARAAHAANRLFLSSEPADKIFLEEEPTVQLTLEQARALQATNRIFLEDELTVDMPLDAIRSAVKSASPISRSEIRSEVVGRISTLKTKDGKGGDTFSLDAAVGPGSETGRLAQVCPGCGSKAFADAAFCTDCGENLPAANATTPNSLPSYASQVEEGNGPRVAARAEFWESSLGSAQNSLASLMQDPAPPPPDFVKMASNMTLSDDESDGEEDWEEGERKARRKGCVGKLVEHMSPNARQKKAQMGRQALWASWADAASPSSTTDLSSHGDQRPRSSSLSPAKNLRKIFAGARRRMSVAGAGAGVCAGAGTGVGAEQRHAQV
jgi:hypothetical protein